MSYLSRWVANLLMSMTLTQVQVCKIILDFDTKIRRHFKDSKFLSLVLLYPVTHIALQRTTELFISGFYSNERNSSNKPENCISGFWIFHSFHLTNYDKSQMSPNLKRIVIRQCWIFAVMTIVEREITS